MNGICALSFVLFLRSKNGNNSSAVWYADHAAAAAEQQIKFERIIEMINDFTAATPAPAIPTAPSIPTYPWFGSGKKKKHSKKRERHKKLKAANKRAEAAVWQAGYMARENELLRQMILLATAAERSKLNSGISEAGLRLVAK